MKIFIIFLIFFELLILGTLSGVNTPVSKAIDAVEGNSYNDIQEFNKNYIRKMYKERGLKEEFISSVLNSCSFRFLKTGNGRVLGSYQPNTKEISIYNTMYFGDQYMFTENNHNTLIHEGIHCYLDNNIKVYEDIKLIYSKMSVEEISAFHNVNDIITNNYYKNSREGFVHELTAYTYDSEEKEYEGKIGNEIRKMFYK